MVLSKFFKNNMKNNGIIVWTYQTTNDISNDEDIRDVNISVSEDIVYEFVSDIANALFEKELIYKLQHLPPNAPYNSDSPKEVFNEKYTAISFDTLIIKVCANEQNKIEISGNNIKITLSKVSWPDFVLYALRSLKWAYISDRIIPFVTTNNGEKYRNHLVFWRNDNGTPTFHP